MGAHIGETFIPIHGSSSDHDSHETAADFQTSDA